jgi:hypothetical protein
MDRWRVVLVDSKEINFYEIRLYMTPKALRDLEEDKGVMALLIVG